MASEHLERYPALHVLVLNAGMAVAGELASYPLRRLDRLFAINVRAPFALVQACLPALREAAAADPDRGAKVVAIASISGVVSEPQLAAYGATKAALISLCQSIAAEESRRGVERDGDLAGLRRHRHGRVGLGPASTRRRCSTSPTWQRWWWR